MTARERRRGGFWQFKLGVKLSIYAVILVATLTGLAFFNSARREVETLREGFQDRTRAVAFVLGSTVLDDVLRMDYAGAGRAIRTIVENDPDIMGATLMVEKENGYEPVASFSELPVREVVETLSEPIRLPGSDRIYGQLRLDFRRETLTDAIKKSRIENMTLFLGISSTAILLTIFLASRLTRPVDELVSITRRLRDGERGARANIVTTDEFGELGRAFNEMADAVEKKDKWLEHIVEDQQRIQGLSIEINTELERGPLMETLHRIWAEAARVHQAGIYLWDPDAEVLVDTKSEESFRPGEGFTGKAFSRREVLGTDDVTTSPEYRPLPGENPERWMHKALLALPIFYQDKVIGVIRLADRTNGKPFYGNERAVLSILASQTAGAIENSRLLAEATTDSLTGLSLRRYFDVRLERLIASSSGGPISLLMLDIDRFKSINDRYGHPFGDRVIVGVARTISGSLRAKDIASRYGGEEFAVLLPGTEIHVARGKAEEIRSKVENLDLKVRGEAVEVSVSIGVAGLVPGDSGRDILARSDEALYKAKEKGRNRVEG